MNIKITRGRKSFSFNLMTKLFLVAILLTTSLVGRSQIQFGAGFSTGYDYSFDGTTGSSLYRRMPYENKSNFPDYNFGVDGIMIIKDWLRVRAEVHYANMGFTRYWNPDLSVTTTGSDERIDFSKVAYSNLDISPMVDLRFVKLGNFEAFATAGFKFEFQMGKWEKTYTLAGIETDDDHVMDNLNKSQAGVNGGLLLKYNLNPNWAVTASPTYTYFFDPLIYQNDYDWDYKGFINYNKYDLKRFTVKLGVEYRF